MSRSYDRSPPLPPGSGGGNPNAPYDAPYDGPFETYDEPTARPGSPPPYMRDGRNAQSARVPSSVGDSPYEPTGPINPRELTRENPASRTRFAKASCFGKRRMLSTR